MMMLQDPEGSVATEESEAIESVNLPSKELILQAVNSIKQFNIIAPFDLVEKLLNKAVVSVRDDKWIDEVDLIQQVVLKHVDNEGASQTERIDAYYAYSNFLMQCGTSFNDPGPKKLRWIEEAYNFLSNMPFFDEIKTTIMYARAAVLRARNLSEKAGNKILDKAIKRISEQLVTNVGDKNVLLALLKMEKTRFVCTIDVDNEEEVNWAKTEVLTLLTPLMKEIRVHMQNTSNCTYFDPQMHNALFEYRWVMKKSSLIPRAKAVEKQKKVLRRLREDLHLYLGKMFPSVSKRAEVDEWWHECYVMMIDIANISAHLWKDDQEQVANIRRNLLPELQSIIFGE